ncbi:MAG: TetR/AcrR family transcriptional regulator [Nitrospirota bacterium]|nr:TetR/AcrR family transcriptional regulator [Nitrospirota bacterium]
MNASSTPSTPGARASDTRARLIGTAQALLQTHGFAAFSYQHLADELGIRKASIHYHFASKDDLGVAVLAAFRASFDEWVRLHLGQDPHARMLAYLRIYTRFARDHGKACPVAMVSSDFFDLPETVREQARLLAQAHLLWLAATLEEGRQAGVFAFPGEARRQAEVIGCAAQGAVLSARMWGDQRMDDILRQLLAQLAPPPPARPVNIQIMD